MGRRRQFGAASKNRSIRGSKAQLNSLFHSGVLAETPDLQRIWPAKWTVPAHMSITGLNTTKIPGLPRAAWVRHITGLHVIARPGARPNNTQSTTQIAR
jgi:hypothetical protein